MLADSRLKDDPPQGNGHHNTDKKEYGYCQQNHCPEDSRHFPVRLTPPSQSEARQAVLA